MFKTDDKSLERLAFNFSEEDIARFSKLFEVIDIHDLSSANSEELKRLQKGLETITRLKLEGRVYGFHVEDSYAYKQGPICGSGVELYLRQGNFLEEFLIAGSRDYVIQVRTASEYLAKSDIKTIYTGSFSKKTFLGLPEFSDPDDPIERGKLEDLEIEEFRNKGINVIVLDKLL